MRTRFSQAKFFLLIFMAGACGVFGPLRVDRKADGFFLGALAAPWVEQKMDEDNQETVQRLWKNTKTGALISVNTICDRYTGASLNELHQDLLLPIRQRQYLEGPGPYSVQGNQAVGSHVRGKSDGQRVELMTRVLRAGTCVYDFTLAKVSGMIGPEERMAFENVMNGFVPSKKDGRP